METECVAFPDDLWLREKVFELQGDKIKNLLLRILK